MIDKKKYVWGGPDLGVIKARNSDDFLLRVEQNGSSCEVVLNDHYVWGLMTECLAHLINRDYYGISGLRDPEWMARFEESAKDDVPFMYDALEPYEGIS